MPSRRTLALVLGALVVGVLAAIWLGSGPAIANLESAPADAGILVLGDSLAAGTGARPEESYPARLQASLGCRVENAGIPGNTTADGRARIDGLLATKRFIVVIELGGNDFLQKLPKAETEAHLDAMLGKVVASGAIPVVAAVELGLFTDEYGPLFERVADRHHALLVPNLLGGVLGNSKLMSDAIHPNGEGYRLVAERLHRALLELIEQTGKACR